MYVSSARYAVVSIAISTLVLALVLRTWFVLGLIEPVTVAGSSMAPNLRGPHVSVICPKCAQQLDIGAEFNTASVECPRCRTRQTLSDPPVIERGDRLVIDRTAFQFRAPGRWEPVVFRSPVDGQLTVKRVVGLPGETIQLYQGEVLINGKVAIRDLAALRALRQVVHHKVDGVRRWQADKEWRWDRQKWHVDLGGINDWSVLRFTGHPEQPLMTDVPYNNGVTQRLFPIKGLALSARVRLVNGAKLWVIMGEYTFAFSELIADVGFANLEIYAYERSPKVFLNGKSVEHSANMTSGGRPNLWVPIGIQVFRGQAELTDLTVYRDIYHASLNEEHGIAEPMEPIRLKSDEVFVLGDNVPVSVDSRHWGPVPLRLLVGRPIGVR